MDKELSKFFHLTFSHCYLLYSRMVHAPLHVISSRSPSPWLCGLTQQAPHNFLQSISQWLKQQDLGRALAPGSQLPLGLTKIFLLAEGLTHCRELSRGQNPPPAVPTPVCPQLTLHGGFSSWARLCSKYILPFSALLLQLWAHSVQHRAGSALRGQWRFWGPVIQAASTSCSVPASPSFRVK